MLGVEIAKVRSELPRALKEAAARAGHLGGSRSIEVFPRAAEAEFRRDWTRLVGWVDRALGRAERRRSLRRRKLALAIGSGVAVAGLAAVAKATRSAEVVAEAGR